MIWLLLSILTLFASPGDNFTITITQPALIETSDSCLFFVETMNGSAYLPAGSYVVKVGASCEPGVKYVTANGLRIAEVSVTSDLKQENLRKYAIWLESKLMAISSEIGLLREEIENLTQKLNEIESEKSKLEMEKKTLETEFFRLNESYNSLKLRYDLLSEEFESRAIKISQMESEIKSLAEQSATYRIATFFLVSIFVGSFSAMVIMIRRS
ncbi:MAG: hypothetical protein QXU31_05725 [Archaeoglobaceae archaeon]